MQQFRRFLILVSVAPALLGAKKLDLRPVAIRPLMPSAASALTVEPKPSPTLDPYFGFGAPSKNPADYASDTDPYGGIAKNRRQIGTPPQYMGPAARIGDGPGVASLQSYNTGGIHGYNGSGGNAPNPANYPSVPAVHVPPINLPPMNVAPISVR